MECIKADLNNSAHASAVITLLQGYAMDIMGGGERLSDNTQANLIDELKKRPINHTFLAYIDGEAVGVAICFEAFSTFACKPLLNIHDFSVKPEYRRRGVAKALLAYITEYATAMGCCKLTLEVLSNNTPAKAAYTQDGFQAYELDASAGAAEFWQKKLEH